MNYFSKTALFVFALASMLIAHGATIRIRDVARVSGLEATECVGTGMVYGLTNGGDKDPAYAKASMANTLKRFGVRLPAEALTSKNVASVVVTAQVPPVAKAGTKIDVTVSPMGDAGSLEGGVLAQTPLMGADGKVYAIAQGSVALVPQLGDDAGALDIGRNHPVTGSIVSGAVVESDMNANYLSNGAFTLVLRETDPNLASRIAEAINSEYPDSSRTLADGGVQIAVPDEYRNRPVEFIAAVQRIEVETGVRIVYINERTGTIVARRGVESHQTVIGNSIDVVDPVPNEAFPTVGEIESKILNANRGTGPRLLAVRQGGSVTLTWTSDGNEYVLGSSNELAPHGMWAMVEKPTTFENGRFTVTMPVSDNARYYRLRRKN